MGNHSVIANSIENSMMPLPYADVGSSLFTLRSSIEAAMQQTWAKELRELAILDAMLRAGLGRSSSKWEGSGPKNADKAAPVAMPSREAVARHKRRTALAGDVGRAIRSISAQRRPDGRPSCYIPVLD